MKDFSIIAAMDSRQGIGKGGLLPWRLSADMAHFKSVTTSSKSG
ncbi:MAG TPA: dihydrofolate reductase, partial [Candidatus Omnitrophota bacterium]|nr:dihydrofolate reductase [Candidatus Omnitrophota bacterium]